MAAGASTATLLVCKYCLREEVKECLKCKSLFCPDHASTYSPNFCKDCFNNFAVVFDKFLRTSSEYDPIEDTVHQTTTSANRIRIEGADWVYYTQWINRLSDEDMKSVYEFHFFILKLIEHHNESRKIAKARKLAQQPMPLSTKTTKEVKIRKEVKQKNMQEELERIGLKPDMVKVMVEAAGITYVTRK